MTNPIYYSGTTVFADNNNGLVGLGAAGYFQALGNLINGAPAGVQTLYFFVSTAGQASTVVTLYLSSSGPRGFRVWPCRRRWSRS